MAKKEYEKMNRLKVVMAEKDITAAELADRVGLTAQTINRIRRNESQPTIKLLREIAKALDVDVRDLLVSTK